MAREIKPRNKTKSFIGKSWSQYPPHNINGDLNIVSGKNKVISDILSIVLTQKGEASFLHPDYGINPALFSPLSEYDPDVFSIKLSEQIKKWVDSIQTVNVETQRSSVHNQLTGLTIIITFITISSPSKNLLTFDYYKYEGAMMEGDIDTFLDSVKVGDERFTGVN